MFRDLLKKHPVLRYGALLACLLAAGVTVWISYLANPSSAPWLAALYLTVGVLLSTLRRVGEPGLYRSFALYQLCVLAYLWIVWTVYVTPPGPDPAATAEALYFLFRWFGIGGCYVAAGLLHFTIRFARAEGRIWSWIEGGVWLAAAGFHVLQSCGLISEAMIYAGNKWVPSFSAYYPYFFGYISFVLTLALGLPVAKAVTARSRALRLQMFYFIVGALPVWVSCWTHFLMSMGFRLPGLGGIMYLAHVAILGYAVLVRRVYDVSVVIRRGLAYATISVLMGLLYAGLMAASWRWLGAQELFHGILATTAFLALAGLLYAPLLHLMQGWVDRVFFRARADREALLAEHAQQMASTLSLDEVMRRMADLLRRGLDARRVILFLVASSGAPEAYGVQGESFSAAREMSDDSGMADWRRWLARERPTECRVVSGERDAAPEAGLRMTEGREYLAVPVRHRDATLAWAILEPKRADEPYEPDELLFARTVAGNVSVALQNARRYAQIEQLQRLARQTIAGLSAGVLLLREDGSILLDNPAARKLLSASDPPPAALADYARDRPEPREVFLTALRDGAARENVPLDWQAPEPCFVLWSFRRLTDDPQEGALYLLLIHDLTAYKALEAEVRRQEGLAQLGRMIAAINHELNNLMQPVRYQVSKLVDLEIDHPVFQRAQALIPERLAAMERMLQGLRDYARPLELRARPLEPRPLLESVLRDFEAEAARDGVALSLAAVPNLPEVQGDGTWLRQVFHNLVRNAIEASWGRPGPEVRLRADAQDGELIVEVSDNGAGVAPELRERIFEPFFSTKEDAGTGLGLPLCRKIVERHGGRIELESAPGAGARFIVRLPAAARRDAAATAAT